MATPIRRGPRRVSYPAFLGPREQRKATVAKAPIRRGKSVTVSSPRAKARKATVAKARAKRSDAQQVGKTRYKKTAGQLGGSKSTTLKRTMKTQRKGRGAVGKKLESAELQRALRSSMGRHGGIRKSKPSRKAN